MAPWRSLALILAILAFLLTADALTVPLLSDLLLRVGRMPFFWLGVFCLLAAVWGRDG
jgi:hypothetical protein